MISSRLMRLARLVVTNARLALLLLKKLRFGLGLFVRWMLRGVRLR